jgi:hypothetical protein
MVLTPLRAPEPPGCHHSIGVPHRPFRAGGGGGQGIRDDPPTQTLKLTLTLGPRQAAAIEGRIEQRA